MVASSIAMSLPLVIYIKPYINAHIYNQFYSQDGKKREFHSKSNTLIEYNDRDEKDGIIRTYAWPLRYEKSKIKYHQGHAQRVLSLKDSWLRETVLEEDKDLVVYKICKTLEPSKKRLLVTLLIPKEARRVTLDSDLHESRAEFVQVLKIVDWDDESKHYDQALSLFSGDAAELVYTVGSLVYPNGYEHHCKSYREGHYPGIYVHKRKSYCNYWLRYSYI